MGWCHFSSVDGYHFLTRAIFWSEVNKRLQPTGETVSTKQGIHHKYQIPEQNRYEVNDEVPSGIICDAMDILGNEPCFFCMV